MGMEGSRITYVVVKQGETLADLSARYQISQEELLDLNRGREKMSEGDVIKVWQQRPTFEQPRIRTTYVLGFYASSAGLLLPGSASSFERHNSFLTSIAPYWFDLDSKAPGRIKPRVTTSGIKALLADAKAKNVRVLASIHNTDKQAAGVSKTELLHNVIGAHRLAFFNHLFALLEEYGFDGVNLDFEHLKPEDRSLYTEFVRELAERAHQKGYQVVVDLQTDARVEPFDREFDYRNLAEAADYVLLLTYDNYKPTEPITGPVAALPWVQETVEKTLATGVPAEKILLGIPAYGYDWTVGQAGARALSFQAVEKLRSQHGSQVAYHPEHRVPHFDYTDNKGHQHEVWYEDARSLSHKLDLVRKYNLGGIGLWRLGLEDPALWGVIRAKLSPIEK